MKVDKAHGMLIGVAYGDALGAPCEFNGKGKYVPDKIHSNWFFEKRNQYNFRMKLQPGQVTDDTEMTISLMRALEKGYNKTNAINEYHTFVNSGTYCLGTNTKSLLHGYKTVKLYDKKFAQKFSTLSAIENSQSNGHLMRISPAALLSNANSRRLVSEMDCLLTNPSSNAKFANLFYVELLHFCLLESNVGTCKNHIHNQCQEKVLNDIGHCFRDALKSVYDRDLQNQRGWNMHSLSVALWASMNSDSFHEGVVKIIRCGGDTDTNAAIGGALLGAIYGQNNMMQDEHVVWNVDFIFNKTESKIESGNGNYDKCLLRDSMWHPRQLLNLSEIIMKQEIDNYRLEKEIQLINSALSVIRKRTTKDAKTIAFIGCSRSGKTTLSRACLSALKNKGFTCEIIANGRVKSCVKMETKLPGDKVQLILELTPKEKDEVFSALKGISGSGH